MAVSYGATFPVIVLLLSIAFTGYLEVNCHQFMPLMSLSLISLLKELMEGQINAFDFYPLWIVCLVFFYIIAFPLIVFRSGILRYHQMFSGCQVCPEASPLRQHCESLWSLSVSSSHCSWPSSIMWAVWFFYLRGPYRGLEGLERPCAQHIICFLLKVFLPGNNCTALTNRTELEDLKLYTGPVSTLNRKEAIPYQTPALRKALESNGVELHVYILCQAIWTKKNWHMLIIICTNRHACFLTVRKKSINQSINSMNSSNSSTQALLLTFTYLFSFFLLLY